MPDRAGAILMTIYLAAGFAVLAAGFVAGIVVFCRNSWRRRKGRRERRGFMVEVSHRQSVDN